MFHIPREHIQSNLEAPRESKACKDVSSATQAMQKFMFSNPRAGKPKSVNLQRRWIKTSAKEPVSPPSEILLSDVDVPTDICSGLILNIEQNFSHRDGYSLFGSPRKESLTFEEFEIVVSEFRVRKKDLSSFSEKLIELIIAKGHVCVSGILNLNNTHDICLRDYFFHMALYSGVTIDTELPLFTRLLNSSSEKMKLSSLLFQACIMKNDTAIDFENTKFTLRISEQNLDVINKMAKFLKEVTAIHKIEYDVIEFQHPLIYPMNLHMMKFDGTYYYSTIWSKEEPSSSMMNYSRVIAAVSYIKFRLVN